ncbi:hypothetical protein DXG03_004776 [Asterophora parasitica]|uniref:Uncharacterized protein n=1 Tax=Asterophora parasitica TaxID=117018 RepID=A0A9P7K8W1_9AGAR|nr:hypothetical protein DXG03_004776 [Asterophora parasitica]
MQGPMVMRSGIEARGNRRSKKVVEPGGTGLRIRVFDSSCGFHSSSDSMARPDSLTELSYSQFRQYKEELSCCSIPYGGNLTRRAIRIFASIPNDYVYLELTAPQKVLVSKCFEMHRILAHRTRDDPYWITNHQGIRLKITKLLSFSGVKQRMSDGE